MLNWREIWGSCLLRHLLYTTKNRLCFSSRIWMCVFLLKKHITFLSKKWQWQGVNNLCNVAGIFYSILQKHEMWLRVVTDSPPHHHEPEVGPMCHGWMHSGRWHSPGLRHTHVHPSLTYRQNLVSSLKTTECHCTLQSTLSWHQSSLAWMCRGVCASLVRGTWSESCCWMLFGQPSLLEQCVNLDVHLYYAAVQNLIYGSGSGNVPQTTTESSNIPLIHCAQHVQQSIDMSIQHPMRPRSNSWSCSTGVCTRRRGMVVP